MSFLVCCTNSYTERNVLSSVKPSHSRGIFLWYKNFSRGPIMKHNHHIFPKWVILPRISNEDKLFFPKQEWRTKLFSLEREDICRVTNISLCAFLKYFLSWSGRSHTRIHTCKKQNSYLFDLAFNFLLLNTSCIAYYKNQTKTLISNSVITCYVQEHCVRHKDEQITVPVLTEHMWSRKGGHYSIK